jgi:hypothetical protein
MNRGSIQGFSAGIIFATSIIGGYYFLSAKDEGLSFHTAKQVIEQEGYTVVKKNNQKIKQSEKAPENLGSTQINKETSMEDPGKQTKVDSSQNDPTKKTNNQNQNQTTSSPSYTLTIKSGMTSETIADLLVKNGIIKDDKAFKQYLDRNNLNTRIQIGSFVLTKEMSIEQIAKTIAK